MIRKLIGIIAAMIIAVASAVAFTAPAQAEPIRSFHIQNSDSSDTFVAIYSATNCTGTRVQLDPDERATSTGWDCFRSPGSMQVTVFEPGEANPIAFRTYPPYTNVRAYPDHDYLVGTFN